MTTMITGGTGFLGSNIAKALIKQGEKDIVLFECNINKSRIEDIADQVKIVRGDVGNWAEVMEAVKYNNVKRIFHTAALLSGDAELYPMKAIQVNMNGVWNILEAARLFGVERVICASTRAVYGRYVPDPIYNDAPQYPTSIYGATKIAGEKLGEYYNLRYGVDYRAIRYATIIGPGRGTEGISAFATLIVEKPARNEPYKLLFAKDYKITILYIDDAVQATLKLANTPNEALRRRVYNVEGIYCSVEDMANAVRRVLPEAQLSFAPDEKLIARASDALPPMDDTFAKEDWGWKRTIELDDMIPMFVDGVRKKL